MKVAKLCFERRVLIAVPPVVKKNDEVSIDEIKVMLESGIVQNIVISPGPGSPDIPEDIGKLRKLTQPCHVCRTKHAKQLGLPLSKLHSHVMSSNT